MRLQTPIRAISTPFFKIFNIFTCHCCQAAELKQNVLQNEKAILA
jgi:hypothetical protein